MTEALRFPPIRFDRAIHAVEPDMFEGDVEELVKTGRVDEKRNSSAPSSASPQARNGFDSAAYWSKRYRTGGNSGAGSYGRLAAFKAEVINAFVAEHGIGSVIEFGCGDGAQLKLARYPSYLGFDVADESVAMCRAAFGADATKAFRNARDYNHERADLTLSLDVIYHLIEDEVFHEYMRRLFFSADRYVIVYSSNRDANWPAAHVRHRKFTDWVEKYHTDFRLLKHIPNRYPLVGDEQNESFADFYIFEKLRARRHTLPGELVVSLTSWVKRFPTLELTLRRILHQSMLPDRTILWIAPRDIEHLPRGVLDLQRCGLSIRITEDIRSYKKIIPALKACPEAFILTLDDDQIYPRDVIEPLVTNYRSPKEILCRRANQMRFNEKGELLPYMQWRFDYPDDDIRSDLFPTGCNGVLYPPGSLAPDVLDQEKFMSLAPHADDVWLFWMGRRAGSTTRRVGRPWHNTVWPGTESSSLMQYNWNGGNDRQIAAMMEHYGSPF